MYFYKETCLSTNELNSSLPSAIVTFLQDFDYVFPNEVPDGLPPIRRIEHQIDFIPRATIPNKLAYRSNLEETKELQKHVKELLAKGICEGEHESMCGTSSTSAHK